MQYALTLAFQQPSQHLLQAIGMGENSIEAFNFVLLFMLGSIEQHKIHLALSGALTRKLH